MDTYPSRVEGLLNSDSIDAKSASDEAKSHLQALTCFHVSSDLKHFRLTYEKVSLLLESG